MWMEGVPSDVKIFKRAYVRHPMCMWVRSSKANFRWCVKFGYELCYEYTRRYGRIHACQKAIDYFDKNCPPCNNTELSDTAFYSQYNFPKGCTPPPLTMPQEYYDPDLINAYRNFYLIDKAHILDYKQPAKVPGFIQK